MSQLKLCPFCGEAPAMIDNLIVRCSGCGVHTSRIIWNTRIPSTQEIKALVALHEIDAYVAELPEGLATLRGNIRVVIHNAIERKRNGKV